MIVLSTDEGNISPVPIALLGTSKWLEHIVRLRIYYSTCTMIYRIIISPGLKSLILHLVQVSPSTWVSKTFRLTENNLLSYHLGLYAQTLYLLVVYSSRRSRMSSSSNYIWEGMVLATIIKICSLPIVLGQSRHAIRASEKHFKYNSSRNFGKNPFSKPLGSRLIFYSSERLRRRYKNKFAQ